jgi:leader peptidase (prepilin peptidase) / N-methyltransferase
VQDNLDSWIFSLLAAWLVATGLTLGSFLNVVIARVPMDQSIVRPRSRCPHCGHQLPWYENIPLFSYLALRGKCSACRAPISLRYPFVELLTGLLFLACLSRFGWTWELVRALVLVSFLIPLTFIDLEHWLLPFSLTIPGLVLGLLSAIPLGLDALRDAAVGAAVGFGAFWGLEWVGQKIFRKEALGGGDKWLLAMLGAFLTYRSLLGIILLSSLQGSIVGLTLLAVRGRAGPAPSPEPEPKAAPKSGSKSEQAGEDDEEDDWVPGPTNIPFGPWLALAGLELLLLGPWIESVLPPGTGWLLAGT